MFTTFKAISSTNPNDSFRNLPSNLFPPSIPEQLKGDDYSTREKGSEFPWERLTPDLFLDAPLCPLIKAPP